MKTQHSIVKAMQKGTGRQGIKTPLQPSHIEGYGGEATTPSSPHPSKLQAIARERND